MAKCQVVGCKNYMSKSGKSFFSIPNPEKHPEKIDIVRQWLSNIGSPRTVETFEFSKNKVVCEDHFLKEDLDVNRKAKFLGYKPYCKRLKPFAVPVLFSNNQGAIKSDGEARNLTDKEHDGLGENESSDVSGNASPSTSEVKDSPASERFLKTVDFRNYGRKLSYSRETDEKLLRWVQDQTSLGETVTKDRLKEQALLLVQHENADFKASNGWLEKFLTRHGIVLTGSRQAQSHYLVNSPVPTNGNNSETRRNGTSSHGDRLSATGGTSITEGLIKEPAHLTELLQQASTQSAPNSVGSVVSIKDDDEDNDDDDDDDADPDDIPSIRRPGSSNHPINPERLKAFNMFVRLFVDENLDRLVPISKQPKDKIGAIIMSCQRQFPEFGDRARKRIRTYLKSCRRSSRLREPMKRTAEHISISTAHIPSTQLSEVNNILAKACHNESHEAAKRSRIDTSPGREVSTTPNYVSAPAFGSIPPLNPINQQGRLPLANAENSTTPVKLSSTEVAAVRQMIAGYRESAAFLYRSAEELENLLRRSESHYSNQ